MSSSSSSSGISSSLSNITTSCSCQSDPNLPLALHLVIVARLKLRSDTQASRKRSRNMTDSLPTACNAPTPGWSCSASRSRSAMRPRTFDTSDHIRRRCASSMLRRRFRSRYHGNNPRRPVMTAARIVTTSDDSTALPWSVGPDFSWTVVQRSPKSK